MSRKAKTNIGPFEVSAPTSATAAYESVLMVERFIKNLLRDTIEVLLKDPDELRRFFSAFFDSTIGEEELNSFVASFIKSPPRSVLGYARSGAELPIFATVLTSEEESDAFLGDFVGQHEDERSGFENTGAFFDATYSVYVYSTHPDMCAVLYQFAKAVIHAGKGFLMSNGVLEVKLGGGELAPDENYMPENMFVRVLRVTAKHPFSAPVVKPFDPTRVKVTGIFGSDVVVDGLRGGVKAVEDDG